MALERRLAELRRSLEASGIRHANIDRMLAEYRDHVEDLASERISDGDEPAIAIDFALEQMGEVNSLVAAADHCHNLKAWWRRFPRVAVVVYPVAYLVALPAVPVMSGVRNAAVIGRWLTCLVASGIVTAALMLALTLSIYNM